MVSSSLVQMSSITFLLQGQHYEKLHQLPFRLNFRVNSDQKDPFACCWILAQGWLRAALALFALLSFLLLVSRRAEDKGGLG